MSSPGYADPLLTAANAKVGFQTEASRILFLPIKYLLLLYSLTPCSD